MMVAYKSRQKILAFAYKKLRFVESTKTINENQATQTWQAQKVFSHFIKSLREGHHVFPGR